MLMEDDTKTRYTTIPVSIVFILSIILAATGCGDGGSPTTTTSAPPITTTTAPPTTTAAAWNPNGVISAGEYTSNKSFTSGVTTLTLYWKTDAQYIYMGMEAAVAGYIAVALDPDGAVAGKTNTDMIWGYVANGQAFLFDMWATTESGSTHPEDTAQGGRNDIVQFGGAESGGKTIIEFKRLLNTGDPYDQPFVAGTNRIMWAVHAIQDALATHTAVGRGEITI